MRATTAHRAPERVADKTCTQVWTWMTNRCRRRMNRREGYITIEISQRRKRKKGKTERKKEGGTEAPGRREKLGTHILGREVLSP